MRTAIVLCAFLLSACAVKPDQSAPTRVHSFYSTYLMSLTSSDNQYSPSDLREYVSADTLKRLEDIESISEQDLIGSDYFAYAQDYDPSWISALTVGAARPFMGGRGNAGMDWQGGREKIRAGSFCSSRVRHLEDIPSP
ncbi:DUF3828 domain-containing protein [Cronobacter malonaticus]|uniref:DUF3828 domain-containing protein n=1 Tax=Cronobacter malonaticus TaxID=413503 RepID=UPI003B52E272